MDQQTVKLLTYTVRAKEFQIWSTKFLAIMQTKGLYKSLVGTEEQLNDPTPLVNGASNDEKKNHKVLKDAYEKEVADIKEKRNDAWCHLALTLDATTLMLMRHDCVEMTASEMEQNLGSLCKRDFRVWRRRQW